MDLSPVVLFIFNRPEHTRKTLTALENNYLAKESILYVFADGPLLNSTDKEKLLIDQTRGVVKEKKWCKEVIVIESNENKGLADSIIDGVTFVLKKYDKVIVLEDDIVTSVGFLKFMNDALEFYKNIEQVYHISGFNYPNCPSLPETFFYNVPLCWGWATWRRSWAKFERSTDALIDFLDKSNKWQELNKFGGNFLGSQLIANKYGSLKTWFIKWHTSVFINGGFTLYPNSSLVNNIGFDSSGINNGTTNIYTHNFLAEKIEVKKIKIEENLDAVKFIKEFYLPLQPKTKESPSRPKKNEHPKTEISLSLKNKIKKRIHNLIKISVEEIFTLKKEELIKEIKNNDNILLNTWIYKSVGLYEPYIITDSVIGNYSYVSPDAAISKTRIGKFCSIGPNFISGWGIHPTNGISTSPMFYSTGKQNGVTLSENDKIIERKMINIGNDVFIGMNVTVLDGVTIGDGAVIGAGAVVSKDIPPYAIAVGCPIQIVKYRFSEIQIQEMLKIKWW
ncbi:MAG: DapH/DapD/GlmU-related protein, partial [Bacteroidota bacterium]